MCNLEIRSFAHSQISFLSDVHDVVADRHGEPGAAVRTEGSRKICPPHGRTMVATAFGVSSFSSKFVPLSSLHDWHVDRLKMERFLRRSTRRMEWSASTTTRRNTTPLPCYWRWMKRWVVYIFLSTLPFYLVIEWGHTFDVCDFGIESESRSGCYNIGCASHSTLTVL